MKVSATALALVIVAMLAGCGFKVAGTAPMNEVTRTAALVERTAAAPLAHEIATTFVRENAAAEPAEMYPSF